MKITNDTKYDSAGNNNHKANNNNNNNTNNYNPKVKNNFPRLIPRCHASTPGDAFFVAKSPNRINVRRLHSEEEARLANAHTRARGEGSSATLFAKEGTE